MKTIVAITGLLLLGLFVTFVWPTRWRTDDIEGANGHRLVRTDRFTGEAQFLTSSGWTSTRFPTSTGSPQPTCTPEQMAKSNGLPYGPIAFGCTPPPKSGN